MKLDKLFQRRGIGLVAGSKTAPACAALPEEPVSLEKIRAVAIGAALAVSVDASPAVLLNIQAYAERHSDKPRRTA
jgi:hypothetical protein